MNSLPNIDEKMDDGLPTMGKVISSSLGGCGTTNFTLLSLESSASDQTGKTQPSDSIKYNLTSSSVVCIPMYKTGLE